VEHHQVWTTVDTYINYAKGREKRQQPTTNPKRQRKQKKKKGQQEKVQIRYAPIEQYSKQ
jgi:hypothetical protein